MIDASLAKAPEGGEDSGPNPTDRGQSASKHHVLTDAQGLPLAATVTGAHVHEVTPVFDLQTSMPPVGGKPGPQREKPERLQGAPGYDSEPVRQLLRWLGIPPILSQRGREHGSFDILPFWLFCAVVDSNPMACDGAARDKLHWRCAVNN